MSSADPSHSADDNAAAATQQSGAELERREAKADRIGLLLFVATICLVFVLLVAVGYAVRAMFRTFQ